MCDWRFRKQRPIIDHRIQSKLSATYKVEETTILQELSDQLTAYFQGELEQINVPYWLIGSSFQQKVWMLLRKIPYGKTYSYSELSKLMGSEKSVRAVASANGANALSIIIPCHRVIGKNKKLVGYAGGLNAKQKLLELEGVALHSEQYRLF